MTKFIFTVTSAVAAMLGQVYNEKAATVTESVKVRKMVPVSDSISCHTRKAIQMSPNKKQMPS